jgi:uncharacterized protein YkwD
VNGFQSNFFVAVRAADAVTSERQFFFPQNPRIKNPENVMMRKLVSSFVLITAVVGMLTMSVLGQSRAEGEVFALVNTERTRARLGALHWNDSLAKLARDYSRRMAREGFFDHYDSNGRTVIDRAESARIPNWSRIGENLFVCEEHPYFTSTAIRGWMRSRTHRTNMLDRTWTATGVGIATARDGSIFITQVFTHE